MIKKCLVCNNEFDSGKHKNIKTCSKDCLSILRKNKSHESIEKFKETWENKSSRIKKCATCGSEFNTGKHKEKLNCSKVCLAIFKEKHKEERIRKSKEAIKNKYNVEHISQIKDFSEKVKSSKLKRYGDENFNNREKAKNTCSEKYQVDNPMKSNDVKSKTKNTKEVKYGDKNFNNRDKAKDTIKEKYNVEHHLQSPEIIEKMKETNKGRYGVDFTIQTPEAKENLLKKNNSLFGSKYFFSSDIHKNRLKEEKLKNLTLFFNNNNLRFDYGAYTTLRKKSGEHLQYNKYLVTCNVCKTNFEAILVNSSIVCRSCYPRTSTSKIQGELSEFIKSLNVKFLENTRKIINPLELDFYFESENVAIELNGNYRHSEIGGDKDKKYHLNKTLLCNEKGIKLIHVYEDEWILKREIVKSRIKNALGVIEDKIFARKCKINNISNEEKKNFLINNHIQGNSVDSVRLGLFYNDDLVSVMTFSKLRIATGIKNSNEGDWELARFSSKLNTNVVGGFSKLIKHFKSNYKCNKIITYADCRYSGIEPSKLAYINSGFKYLSTSRPSYYYMKKSDYIIRLHRYSMTKHTLLERFGGDKNKTEWQLAIDNGYDRIWDCGSMKFILE
jgi:very-short-patch-repair endonuclease